MDFLLLISSLTGSIGSPTESSYAAANAFMNSFARYRRSHGLPATALGLGVISEVGYLAEHVEMQAVFTRRGIQPIPEDEMLQLVDAAIMNDMQETPETFRKNCMRSHMLTGLELGHAKRQGTGDFSIELLFDDPRAGLLGGLFHQLTKNGGRGITKNSSNSSVSSELQEALARGCELAPAITHILAQKFSGMVLMPVEQLGLDSVLSGFGLDSMLAAEFRTLIYQALGVDVPYMTLLSDMLSITSLTQVVMDARGKQKL